ncbi:LacI family DNA-binding transcriptional regulator [[Brevibacterium] frigoritolerans]|uniref:LacI family DNA-binding transcriptional regulator n=1 Tax=Peribacillus frigoritolerans TaxID=450367 RepID=A0A941FJ75_9BACI|nr:LacI family DNA-binding transcriptional regulator [Peribacillus frigoritolerans]
MTNIKEIAQCAGVSVSTVSRVLNDHPYVSPDKRKSVLEAINRLNYTRNINAIHLSKGKPILSASSSPSTITHITGQSLTESQNRQMQLAVISSSFKQIMTGRKKSRLLICCK